MPEDGAEHTDSAGDTGVGEARGPVRTPSAESGDRRERDGRGALNAEMGSGGFAGAIERGEAGARAERTGRTVGDRGRVAEAATDAASEASEADAATATDGVGRVSLVGAGPGHPDLLTRRAWKRLRAADVVLSDSLTSDAVVADLPESVDVVDVGKRPPNRTSQTEINELLCARATVGERVVRLKGGDPCLFGRGGEEAEHLASEAIPFEIVPGVSSVLAAPGVGGIPLTHREHASSVTVVTGHETPEKAGSALDWDALCDTVAAGGTLVILMGVARLGANVRALRKHGLPPETPAATIQKATWREQETVVASLADVVERNEEAGIEPPAVTIVGDVVAVRERLEAYLVD